MNSSPGVRGLGGWLQPLTGTRLPKVGRSFGVCVYCCGWGGGGLLVGALGPGRSPLPCSGDGAPPPGGWLGATEVAGQVCSGSVAPDLAAGQHARGAVWW